jgi:hypothetical protein
VAHEPVPPKVPYNKRSVTDQLKAEQKTKQTTEQAPDCNYEQIGLFEMPAARPIVDTADSDRLLARDLTKSGKRLSKPRPLKHRQVSSKTCPGMLKRQPKNPNDYLICSKCAQLVSRGLVEAKGFTLPSAEPPPRPRRKRRTNP